MTAALQADTAQLPIKFWTAIGCHTSSSTLEGPCLGTYIRICCSQRATLKDC